MINTGLFTADRQDWATPPEIFLPLDAEFHFTLDVCATADNTKVPSNYYDPSQNGLEQPWTGVYQIFSACNGKRYIGSSVNIAKRWRNHKWDLAHNIHRNRHLQNAWNLYGPAAFEFTILEYVSDVNALTTIEQYYIDWLDVTNPEFGYNINPFATSFLGRRHSSATKTRMSASARRRRTIGRKLSTATCQKISAAKKGKKLGPHSATHRANLSTALKGRQFSASARANMSAAQKARRQHEKSSGC